MEVKSEEKSLKLAAIQHKNMRVESTQLADPLDTTCEPPVEKHWLTVARFAILLNPTFIILFPFNDT
jgi:hypothetical protein